MKRAISILFCIAVTVFSSISAARPFADYQIILNRQPFGTPPEPIPEPERVVPIHESFAAQLLLSGIFDTDDGLLQVAIVDRKDNSYFSIKLGETENDIELIDVDYDAGEAVLRKGSESVVLSMGGISSAQMLTGSAIQERARQGEERRMSSYAERRQQRQLARQRPVEAPQPIYSGEELERHLQDYQMEVIRQGLPPLPVQLTPDRDAQLVSEGLLLPLDEEGYEIEYYEDEELVY